MIIDALKDFFNKCPLMAGENVDVDFLDKKSASYSIDTMPCEPVLKKYISGGSMKQYCFMISGRNSYGTGYNCGNAAFYEKLSEWIEEKNKKGELPELDAKKTAQSIEITASGYMFEENVQSAGYHLQCRLIYTEME